MATAKDILARIKDEEIEWVDLRFTDPKGKWQHLTMVSSVLGEDELARGAVQLKPLREGGGGALESPLATAADEVSNWFSQQGTSR